MAEKYFEKFPIINYANTACVNITERTAVLTSVYQNPLLYYPYDIKPYERPDNIADRYYNDQYLSWVLYMTNKVIDPYYDWYIDQQTMNDFLAKKYGSLQSASQKIKHYQNNWYSYPDMISTQVFQSLDPAQIKYYEPVYGDIFQSLVPLGYTRKRADWTLHTNSIVQYGISQSQAPFNIDEIVSVQFQSGQRGTGQVCGRTTTTVSLQHVSGIAVLETVPATSYLVGQETNLSIPFTGSTTVSQPISAAEAQYWDAITYEQYEQNLNENNKSIQVLNTQYTQAMATQLRNLL